MSTKKDESVLSSGGRGKRSDIRVSANSDVVAVARLAHMFCEDLGIY